MNSGAPAPRWRRILLLCAGTLVFFWQLRNPFLRFSWPLLNLVTGFVLGLSLPWLAALAVSNVERRWSHAVAFVFVLLLLPYSAAFFLFAGITAMSLHSGDPISQIHWKESDIRFYRTDGGATTDVGIVIRQEETLLPGVRMVRRIDAICPCASFGSTATESGIAIMKQGSACKGLPDQRREYPLKRFLYF